MPIVQNIKSFTFFEEKRSKNILNIMKKIKDSQFVRWQRAITHMCVIVIIEVDSYQNMPNFSYYV